MGSSLFVYSGSCIVVWVLCIVYGVWCFVLRALVLFCLLPTAYWLLVTSCFSSPIPNPLTTIPETKVSTNLFMDVPQITYETGFLFHIDLAQLSCYSILKLH